MRKTTLELLSLIIVSGLLIFYKFNQIPANLSFDEVEFAKLALSLGKQHYIPYSPLATGHSTLYFYLILTSFKILGVTNLGLRLPAALFGIGSTVVFYLLIKLIFDNDNKPTTSRQNNIICKYLPFILALLFTTSHWFFNFARFSFEVTFLLFLELVSVYCLFRFFYKKETVCLVLSGLFTGLAFNSYLPGRIFFILPLGFLLFVMIKNNTVKLKHILSFIVPFTIIILPLSFYLLQSKDIRIDQQFFLKNTELTLVDKANFLLQNVASDTLMFNIKGDVNGRHNYPQKPALNPIMGLFFLSGLVLAVYNYKKSTNLFFLGYFLVAMLPSILTYPWENPNMLRTYTVLPSLIFFAGQSILYFYQASKTNRKIFTCTIIFLIAISVFYEIRTYFKYQKDVFRQAFEIPVPLPKAFDYKIPPPDIKKN